ncbi:phosphoenolpyruvate--protein phosphotransferase [Clostridium sp. WB02_MRS01]|uniref:phosphoenolpyruvate-utilizing N-terminal domain-containing protein n=1 Tax=Clostridium sp. WB02_MRS01 TaxID=2605777 RepID=UPI0012B1FA9F|nr:phosphoenolpyruvate-utilizing N-terminal domain-containing protein [Clostridium sp. WB02_MRS01]MSS11332.1 phosphoenolpyruvate--protein phosphotransferase [Clostridium sp. WB02_MRS01]
MKTIKGVPISPGIAIGKVYLKRAVSEEIPFTKKGNTEEEKKRFRDSRALAAKQVKEIYDKMLSSKGEQEASIFLAHIEMLDDIEFIGGVEKALEELGCASEWAVKTVRDNLVEIFESMDDDYMRERAMDIKDISGRVIRILKGICNEASFTLTEPVIIISNDLVPSDIAQMDPRLVLGIINKTGGPTSHTAIIARMLGIPYCICSQITSFVKNGQLLAFDGKEGTIELEVTEDILQDYSRKQEDYRNKNLC